MVRVGVKIPQDGNRTNIYGYVAMINYTLAQGMCGTWYESLHPHVDTFIFIIVF
jgi:hypothetical protein